MAGQTDILKKENGDLRLKKALVNLWSRPPCPAMVGEDPAEWQSCVYLNEIPFCRADLLSQVLCVLDPCAPLEIG